MGVLTCLPTYWCGNRSRVRDCCSYERGDGIGMLDADIDLGAVVGAVAIVEGGRVRRGGVIFST